MTAPDPGEEHRTRLAEARTRRAELTEQYGKPERISESDALALAWNMRLPALFDPAVTADDVYASIYRDDAAADAWAESNLVHNGYPTLAKVPLPDGRVVGILDLRPALKRAAEEP